MKLRLLSFCTLTALLLSVSLYAQIDDATRLLSRDLFRQLIEINTTDSVGNVTTAAEAMAQRLREAGFPEGAFSTVVVPGADVKHLIADPRVAAVTLTGSEPAGVSVASEAGRVLKKTVLELGGSDAFVVLADADVAEAVKAGAKARYQNGGQSCICAKRFIVEAPVYDAFVAAFVAESRALVLGHP